MSSLGNLGAWVISLQKTARSPDVPLARTRPAQEGYRLNSASLAQLGHAVSFPSRIARR